jgi:hypothetical protein
VRQEYEYSDPSPLGYSKLKEINWTDPVIIPEHLSYEEREYSFFEQGGASVCTVNISTAALREILSAELLILL